MGRSKEREEEGLKVSLLTPERKLFLEKEVDYIEVPAEAGYLGILPHHLPLMGILGTGILHLKIAGNEEKYAIDGGFFQLEEETLTLLCKLAWRPQELKRKELEKEKKEAFEILRGSDNPEEVGEAAKKFSRASVFLSVAEG